MRNWGALFNIIAVLALMMWLVVFRNETVANEKTFNELRLQRAVEASAEAAFLESLRTDNIDIDYLDMESVVINPGESMDIFKSLICLNYGLSASEENKAHVESYIPTAVLAANDGYYIAELSEIDTNKADTIEGNEYGLKWSVKKPYALDSSNLGTNRAPITAVNNGSDYFFTLSGSAYVGPTGNIVLPSAGASVITDFLPVNGNDWYMGVDLVKAIGVATSYNSTLAGVYAGVSYYDENKVSVVSNNGYAGNGQKWSAPENTYSPDLRWNGYSGYGDQVKFIRIEYRNDGGSHSSPYVELTNFYLDVTRKDSGSKVYAFNLTDRKWVAVAGNNTDTTVAISRGIDYSTEGFFKEDIIKHINYRITNDMLYQISKRNEAIQRWDYKFYLPPIQTAAGVNAITRPSLLVFMQGVDFASTRKIDAINVSGLTTVTKRVVLGFTKNGIKYYCYAGQMTEAEAAVADDYFNSIEEAAKAGYSPNYDYLIKKIIN